jgi:hypothetical protein
MILAITLLVSSAFDWLPTRGSRETDVDNANTTHGQGDTVLLLLSVDV